MEDTLRGVHLLSLKASTLVLILVLMEDTLRDHSVEDPEGLKES